MTANASFGRGRFQFSADRRQLLIDGRPAVLGARAVDLLQALIARRDRTVSKDELLEAAWPGRLVEEANLPVQISSLRKLLGADVIATVSGLGYRFVAALDDPPEPWPTAGPSATSLADLPVPATPLIGRDDVLAALIEMLPRQRLVTLAGAGGIGKTRLAMAAAAALSGWWPDGVAWVECVSVQDAALLPQALAQALRLGPALVTDMAPLVAALKRRSMLLVLDNFEHLVDDGSAWVDALHRGAPGLHLLVTSQAKLRLAAERVVDVPPLQVPAQGELADERYGAVRLFVERVRAAEGGFRLDADNAEALVDVCRQLDGLPLAIELAAARVRLLGVQGVRDRLRQQWQLLSGGSRVAALRHQTLRATLAWSYSLLKPDEQALLRRLSVFVGGFTLELAERLAAAPGSDAPVSASADWAFVDALQALVDRSLVSVDAGLTKRYRLLETMRAFAIEQAIAAGEIDACRERHATAVAALFAQADEGRWGDDGVLGAAELARRLGPELDNASAALDWAMQAKAWPVAVTLAGAAAALYVQFGRVRSIAPRLIALRPHIDSAPPSAQVNLLWRLGTIGLQAGMSQDELQAVKLEALARARAAGFRRRLQTVLGAMGFTHARRGEVEATRAVIAEMLSLEQADDPVYVRALRLSTQMMLHEHLQETEQVVACLGQQRSLLLGSADEQVPLMTCESNLALYLNGLGRHDEAAAIGQSLLARPELPRSFTHVACVTAYALAALGRAEASQQVVARWRAEIEADPIVLYSGEALAMLCLARGRLADAVRINAALEEQANAPGSRLHPVARAFRARLAAAIEREGPDAADVARWRHEGLSLSDAGAVELALR